MSTAARPIPHDPAQQIEKLQRDLTSAHLRNRTLTKALVRAAAAPSVVAVIQAPDSNIDVTIYFSNGIRLDQRWTAEHGWRSVQAETIPGTLAAIVDGVFATAPVGGMSVVS